MPSPKATPTSKRRKQNRADATLDPTMDLVPRRAAFCREYMVDLNARRAALRAGFSMETAKKASVDLLRDPWVRQEIKDAMDARATRTGITADRILRELGAIALANPADVLTWAGVDVHLRASTDISREDAASISSIKTSFSPTGEKTVEVRFHDKHRAIHLAMQHLGMVGRLADPGDAGAGDPVESMASDTDPDVRPE